MFVLLPLIAPTPRPCLMAHYMPWFQSKPVSGQWGWHWTMNHFSPSTIDSNGNPSIASRYHPLIGPYDSSDPDVLECQTLLMKLAGIDGVFIDWYGVKDLYDYPVVNKNTNLMITACQKVGLKFSIVMEDQVVPNLVKANKSTPEEYAKDSVNYLRTQWFPRTGYARWHGNPILLIFGPQYYKDLDLSQYFSPGISLFTLLGKRGPAVGGFGWPEPQVGDEKSWAQLKNFGERAKSWSTSIPVAYPRFEDIYKEAKVGPGFGEIKDRNGGTFQKTLSQALDSHPEYIQIATWNDWGEGTQIEPSAEFGYRDLETIQRKRRALNPTFPYRPSDLRLPVRLYQLRKSHASVAALNRIAQLALGQIRLAAQSLARLGG